MDSFWFDLKPNIFIYSFDFITVENQLYYLLFRIGKDLNISIFLGKFTDI